MTLSRPDITLAVNIVSQCMHTPITIDMETITKLLHCSKKNKGNVIMFRKWPEFTIEGYIDVDYVGSVDDRRPTSGYGIYLCDNLVIWRSKK